MEMSLHRALIELKTLKKRIAKDTINATYVMTMVGRKEAINGIPIKDVKAKIQGDYDSIISLISNYEKVKYAVIRANAGVQDNADTVSVCGKNYTIAELIEAMNSIYGKDGFKRILLKDMKDSLVNAKRAISLAQAREADEIDRYLKTITGDNNKLSAAESQEQIKLWHELHDVTMIDPLGIENKIQKLEEEIEKFCVEADSTLSEQNALKKIDVDLTSL
jgi:hypothetical protein